MWEGIDTDSIDERLIEEEIYSILNEMHPRYAKVVMLRNGYECTYKEIGGLFKVTQVRARQNDLKALRILRFRYKDRLRKLGIPWIENIFLRQASEEKKEREEQERLHQEWHKKCVEEKIAKEKEKRAREKLKIIDSEISKPEAIVKPYHPKPPHFPPFFVKLMQNAKGQPFLHIDEGYGSINRDLDPVTYDKWLNYLLDK